MCMLRIPGSLRSLLANLIDYAGLYPPAGLPLPIVAERYQCFLSSPEIWMLNRLVLPAARLAEAPLGERWRVTLLVEAEPGPLPRQVETLETEGVHRLSMPTYCEAPLDRIEDGFAKIRTGGLTGGAIPSTSVLAAFLCGAATRRLPFKATAGLHHPLRSTRRLTYETDSPRAVMHGFLNVFTAAAFAWNGLEVHGVQEILEETRADAFEFDEGQLCWRHETLTNTQIAAARREFAHSFGSCSFEEPVSELRQLGLLP
jgi:hypothetical protein